MGVNLASIVPKTAITFDDLKQKKIAVDFSNMAYQFLASIRQPDGTPLQDSQGNTTSHLQGILGRVTNLMEKQIKLAFVFDGKPPLLKVKELEERKYRKEQAQEKMHAAQEEEDFASVYKYSKQSIYVTKEMKEESWQLLEALGMPCIQAPQEAEAQAAYMAQKGDVWASASSDYDSLLFESPRTIRNLTLAQKRKVAGGKWIYTFMELMELEKIKQELKINQEQLIAIGILTGTDYNSGGIKGIGPKKALKLVHEKKTVKEIFKGLECNFDPEEIYETFTKMPKEKKYTLEWKRPNEEKVMKLLVDKHEFNQERIENLFKKIQVTPKAQKGLLDF